MNGDSNNFASESAQSGWLTRVFADSGFRRYFFNTGWSMAENILRLLAGVLVGVYVARYLGPEQFGILSYSLAFVSIFAAVAKLGLDSIVVKEIVENPKDEAELLGTAFWLKLGASFVMLGILVAVISVIELESDIRLYILLIGFGIIFQSFEVVEFYFQAKVQLKYISICKTVHLGLLCLLKLYLIMVEAELIWFVLVNLISPTTLGLLLLVAFRQKNRKSFFGKFSQSQARRFLFNAWPLILSSMVIIIYMRVDQLMIKSMLGEKSVGIYSAAVRLSEVWYFIPTVIVTSLFVAIVNARKVSQSLYLDRLQKLFDLMVRMALVLAVLMVFAGDWLIQTFFGIPYAEAAEILRIHLWAGIFVFLGVASGNWLVVENLQYHAFYRTLAGMLVNIFLNFILIPKFGLKGAAIAVLIANFIAAFLYDLFFAKTRMVFFMKLKSILFYRELKCLIKFVTSMPASFQRKN